MAKLVIKGGKPLNGEVKISGNKNSVLPIMAAAIMTEGKSTLTNVPVIRDVQVMAEILTALGATVDGVGTSKIVIDPTNIKDWRVPADLSRRIRASVVLAAPLLVRFGKVELPLPGGDSIGERALGTHFDMLTAFGARIKPKEKTFEIVLPNNPQDAEIFLEEASVTATEMALMVGAGLKVKTTILDSACEPHIVDLADFLRKSGAKIENDGNQEIRIQGKKNLKGSTHQIRPDHIEAGTYAIAAAITGGNVKITCVVKKDLPMTSIYLSKMGVKQRFIDDCTWEILPSELSATQKKFQTRPWPGFPTDLLSPFIVLATQTKGIILCHDWMYEWRIFFVDYLIKMGADIMIADPHRIIITGPKKLHGDYIPSTDIRAGAALLLASLVAKGESEIEHSEIIERGYEFIDQKLINLGADIQKIV